MNKYFEKLFEMDLIGIYDADKYHHYQKQALFYVILEHNRMSYNYSVEDTAKLQQLIDSGQFELAEQLQIGLIELYNKTN